MYRTVVTTYLALTSYQVRLAARLKTLEPHKLYKRFLKGGNVSYKKIIIDKDGKKHYKTITQSEYVKLYRENSIYHEAVTEKKHLEALLKMLAPTVRKFKELMRQDGERLAELGRMSLPESQKDAIHKEKLCFRTLRGESVRSKTEQTVADMLYNNGISYEYEKELPGFDYKPDFYIYDSARKEPVIWEHFGRMNDPSYVYATLEKIRFYETQGFVLGVNFIATFEFYTGENVSEPDITVDSRAVSDIINNWFSYDAA